MLAYEKNFILTMLQQGDLWDWLTEIQFDTQNIYTHLETFIYQYYQSNIDKPPDLQYPLFDIKDQLQSCPWLALLTNIQSDIWSYSKFLKF